MTAKVWQITGYKNSGKTTLITALIPLLKAKGCRTAVVKHDTHGFNLDHPGTDTHSFHEAGADTVAITSPYQTAVIVEEGETLQQLVDRFQDYDVILVEGFKQELYPKLLLLRDHEDEELLESVRGVKGLVVHHDMKKEHELLLEYNKSNPVPVFTWNETDEIAAFLWHEMKS
ncbi:MAG: molybdopterin-guanine dinucleotide biosynthesis protein B [Bacillota bacterium]